MIVRLFVYGTLKEGFPNHRFNTGKRLAGCYRTMETYPLLVVRLQNEDRAPWLVNQPGQGHQVIGQVFELAGASLPAIDKLEEVGLATGYVRETITLQDCAEPGNCMLAYAYLKPEQHLPQCLEHEGPFQEYTHELAKGYWLRQN